MKENRISIIRGSLDESNSCRGALSCDKSVLEPENDTMMFAGYPVIIRKRKVKLPSTHYCLFPALRVKVTLNETITIYQIIDVYCLNIEILIIGGIHYGEAQ